MSDWDELQRVWRSNEPPEIGDLRNRLKRQTRRIRAWAGGECILLIASLAFSAWIAAQPGLLPFGVATAAITLFAGALSWRAWRGTWSATAGTPAEAIRSALMRNEALRRYVRYNYLVSIAVVLLIGGFIAIEVLAENSPAERIRRGLIGVTAGFSAVVVWLSGCGLYAERLGAERERLRALARAMDVTVDRD